MTWKVGCLGELADVVSWTPPPWSRSAACRNHPTWWWFYKKPGRDSGFELAVKAQAKGICSVCPVRWKCLAEYIDQPFGIFGGFDEEERAAIPVRFRSPDKLRDYFDTVECDADSYRVG